MYAHIHIQTPEKQTQTKIVCHPHSVPGLDRCLGLGLSFTYLPYLLISTDT